MNTNELEKIRSFAIYRYLLTVDTSKFESGLFQTPDECQKQIEQLELQKNTIFINIVKKLEDLTSKKRISFYNTNISTDEDCVLLRVQTKKTKKVEQRFENKEIPHEPSIWVAFDCAEHCQTIAVEKSAEYRQNINKWLTKPLQDELFKEKLHLEMVEVKKSESFWDYVEDHKTEIKKVRFIIHSPNMARMHDSTIEGLLELTKDTKGKNTIIETSAQDGAVLGISPQNKMMSKMVDVSNKGGADYGFKLKDSGKIHKPDDLQEIVTGAIQIKTTPELFPENNTVKHDINKKETILTKIRRIFKLSE